VFAAGLVTFEDRRQVLDDRAELQVLTVEAGAAGGAVPLEGIQLTGASTALDDKADGIGATLRRVGHPRRQQEHLPLLDLDVARLAVIDDLQGHVPFNLEEDLLTGIDVVVGPRIGAADDHDDELVVDVHFMVAHRRLQQVAVVIDELLEVDGRRDGHTRTIEGHPVTDKGAAASDEAPMSNATAPPPQLAHPTTARQYRYYDLVLGAFVCVLLCSNLIGVKKVTTLDLPVLGAVTFGAGNLFFPISYLFGDILTEVYGYARSRRVVWAGFAALMFASFQSAVVVHLPPADFFAAPDAATGASPQAMLEWSFGATWRIAGASLIAYFCGEFMNSFTLAKLKVWTNGRMLPLRTIGSTVVGEAVDSVIFYPLAFYGVWPDRQLVAVLIANYCIKVGWEVVATPVTIPIVNWFKRRENEDYFDRDTQFTPFSLKV
jgi:uncharacterized integral membrane protein (TIGR00697 family)